MYTIWMIPSSSTKSSFFSCLGISFLSSSVRLTPFFAFLLGGIIDRINWVFFLSYWMRDFVTNFWFEKWQNDAIVAKLKPIFITTEEEKLPEKDWIPKGKGDYNSIRRWKLWAKRQWTMFVRFAVLLVDLGFFSDSWNFSHFSGY